MKPTHLLLAAALGMAPLAASAEPTSAMMNSFVRQYVESCFSKYIDNAVTTRQQNICRQSSLGDQVVQSIESWVKDFNADFARQVNVINTAQVTRQPNVWNASWQEAVYDGSSDNVNRCRIHEGTFVIDAKNPKNFDEISMNPSMLYVTKIAHYYSNGGEGPCK